MKRKMNVTWGILILAVGYIVYWNTNDVHKLNSKMEELRIVHQEFLKKSSFKNTKELTKKERFEQGLPPNKYLEREWELTMNPQLGRPTPENLAKIQKELKATRFQFGRSPGDASDNNWVERGPDNVGGRTRAVIFDPNDGSNETVFAGGVSGGLWKNTNISNPSSVWTQINIPENLNITSIASDPNNSNVFYVGTGESYVGDVSGNGVWKSSDGGDSWANVFGGIQGETNFVTNAKVTVNSPTVILGDYGALDSNYNGTPLTSNITGNLVLVDDGTANPSEGCNALTMANAAAVNGNIAVIYRANCNFTVKVKNAENAGAIAVVMINNISGPPITMGGDDASITIPAVMVSNTDGQLMVDQLGSGVNVTLESLSPSVIGFVLSGNQYVNDIIVKDNAGVSEVYVAASSQGYFASNPIAILGPDSYGLFKSINGGASWTIPNIALTAQNTIYEPNDLELGADGKIWMSTTRNIYGDGGGAIFSSADGTNFTLQHTLTDASRTQIATSPSDAQKIYVLAQGTTGLVPIIMIITDDGFTSTSNMALPNDADPMIGADDFARGQAFYDLVIKVDPEDETNVFVGGIDLFKSADSGTSWSQFSHWYGGFSQQYVHADQHAIAFGNGDSSKILFGNDGGVFYSSDSGTTTTSRNSGFNVTQFYSVGVAPTTAKAGDYFAAGAQDNGTQYFDNAGAGINSSVEDFGGDGAITLFDQDGTDTYYIRNFVYNLSIIKRDFDLGINKTINSESDENGDFINQQDLDSDLNILYTNYSDANNNIIRSYDFSDPVVQKTEFTDALLTGRPSAFKVSPFTPGGGDTTLYVGSDNGVLLRIVGANNPVFFQVWSSFTGPEFYGSISDIEFGQTEDEIFVTMHNYGVENIWYTADGGTNWVTKEGDLPDLPVKAILQNPLNTEEVIIGTELGVWYTNNFSAASPNWHSAFNGMSNVKVTDLDLRDDNVIFAATYGRGIFSGSFTATSLGVSKNEVASSQIRLYPTISNGEFSILSKNSLGKVEMSLFTITGQKVYNSTFELSNIKKSFNLSLSSGLYLIKIKGDNFEETKRIIIK